MPAFDPMRSAPHLQHPVLHAAPAQACAWSPEPWRRWRFAVRTRCMPALHLYKAGQSRKKRPPQKKARQRCCELVNACDVQARGRKSPVPFLGRAYEFQEENHESTIGPAVNRISARDREHRPCQRGDVQRDEGHDGPEKCEENMSHHNLLQVIEQVREPPECKPSQNVGRGCEIWCCATE